MTSLYLVNIAAVLFAGWAVWVRRFSFGSPWDAPITIGTGLYGVASALDTPWPTMAAASFPVTGKYYLLPFIGHLCFLAGTAFGIKSVFARLLPDHGIGAFMRTRIAPVALAAAAVMTVCILATPITSTMPADYLYAAPLDGWLRTYFVTFFGAMVILLWTAVFGGKLLLGGPDSGVALPLIGTASSGSVAFLVFTYGILAGRHDLVILVWHVGFIGTALASLACAVSWQRRLSALRNPTQDARDRHSGFSE